MSTFPRRVSKCTNCGSEDLDWESSLQYRPAGMGPDRASPIFVLGCVDCSETLEVVDAEHVAAWLNTPTPAPVPVAERLPGPKDCDSEGSCWMGDYDVDTGHWFWIFANPEDMGGWIRWLPHWALPLPEAS